MKQRFIAVTESAPTLTGLEAELAMKFVEDYDGYRHRNEGQTELVPMRLCLDRDDLDYLLAVTDGQVAFETAVEVPLAVPEGTSLVADLNAETAGGAGSNTEADVSDDSSSEATTVKIDRDNKKVKRLSNEHVLLMLVIELGPQNVDESHEVFEKLRLKQCEVMFSSMSNAITYIKSWKVALNWCQRQIPKQKFLVKQFIKGLPTQDFKSKLAKKEYNKLDDVMRAFLNDYKAAVNAKKQLKSVGGFTDGSSVRSSTECHSKVNSGGQPKINSKMAEIH